MSTPTTRTNKNAHQNNKEALDVLKKVKIDGKHHTMTKHLNMYILCIYTYLYIIRGFIQTLTDFRLPEVKTQSQIDF